MIGFMFGWLTWGLSIVLLWASGNLLWAIPAVLGAFYAYWHAGEYLNGFNDGEGDDE